MAYSRRIKIIIFAIIGLAVCCGGIYVFLIKFYFYNKYNIHAQRAALESLNYRYNQEFELMSTEFETKETLEGGAAYVHLWTYELQDNKGRNFLAYVRVYGLVEKGDGNFYASDYSGYIEDTYGQVINLPQVEEYSTAEEIEALKIPENMLAYFRASHVDNI